MDCYLAKLSVHLTDHDLDECKELTAERLTELRHKDTKENRSA